MNIPVAIVDENGSLQRLVMDEKMIAELSKKLRQEGITAVHTMDGQGNMKTYQAQAIILMAKGCKGSVLFLPNLVE